MTEVKVSQADREAAAKFTGDAWYLFRPNDYERAMRDVEDIKAGRCDNWGSSKPSPAIASPSLPR